MICKNCGAELPDIAKFCDSCGSKVENIVSDATNDTNSGLASNVAGSETGGSVRKVYINGNSDTSGDADSNAYANTPAMPDTSEVSVSSPEENAVSDASTSGGTRTPATPKKTFPGWVIGVIVGAAAIIVVIGIVFIMGTTEKPMQSDVKNPLSGNDDVVVCFEYNNGDGVSEVFMAGESYITEPVAPVREGYIFSGWYQDSDFTIPWDFENNVITDDVTLYAKWEVYETEKYAENERIVIAGGGLRLRKEPTTNNSRVFTIIPNGTHIFIENTVAGWAYTTYGQYSGWVSSDFLFDPELYEGELLYYANVDEYGATMTVDYRTISIPAYELVEVYKVDGKSAYIYYNGEYGWCPLNELVEIFD